MTHSELVDRAVRWLKKTRRCGVVFREHTADFEHPDALGFKTASSILVECKVSRADFLADQKKRSRVRMAANQANRPAFECWYMAPTGLLRECDIPSGWGLVVADGPRVRVVVNGTRQIDDRSAEAMRHEVYRLYCEVRRYQLHGLTYPTLSKGRAEAT